MKIWQILAVALILFSLIGGLLFDVPRLPILNESVRNLYFHVPMWFAMVAMLAISVWQSVRYLIFGPLRADVMAVSAANAGVFFGIMGLLSGALWARYTWGAYWSGDPKQNASAIGMLIYLAYFVLRGNIDDKAARGRISAVYNIFAFAIFIPLIFILPRFTDSLHPGNGGNPGFNAYDLDNRMRLIFYPTILGWILMGWWLTTTMVRIKLLGNRITDLENSTD